MSTFSTVPPSLRTTLRNLSSDGCDGALFELGVEDDHEFVLTHVEPTSSGLGGHGLSVAGGLCVCGRPTPCGEGDDPTGRGYPGAVGVPKSLVHRACRAASIGAVARGSCGIGCRVDHGSGGLTTASSSSGWRTSPASGVVLARRPRRRASGPGPAPGSRPAARPARPASRCRPAGRPPAPGRTPPAGPRLGALGRGDEQPDPDEVGQLGRRPEQVVPPAQPGERHQRQQQQRRLHRQRLQHDQRTRPWRTARREPAGAGAACEAPARRWRPRPPRARAGSRWWPPRRSGRARGPERHVRRPALLDQRRHQPQRAVPGDGVPPAAQVSGMPAVEVRGRRAAGRRTRRRRPPGEHQRRPQPAGAQAEREHGHDEDRRGRRRARRRPRAAARRRAAGRGTRRAARAATSATPSSSYESRPAVRSTGARATCAASQERRRPAANVTAATATTRAIASDGRGQVEERPRRLAGVVPGPTRPTPPTSRARPAAAARGRGCAGRRRARAAPTPPRWALQ